MAAAIGATKIGRPMPTPRIGWARAWQIAAMIAVAIRPRPQRPFFYNK